jgi:hypothetical protein
VTYRRGQVLAAYLTLSRPTGQKVSRTRATADGLLVVDFGSNGLPIGIRDYGAVQGNPGRLNELL